MNNPLPTQSNEADILARIGKARGTSEPVTAPTEEPISLVVTPDEVEVEEVEELSETLETEVETVELDETEQPESDQEEFYVDLGNEREVSFKQIKEWEQGSLRQSDYTRKTQALADDRKLFDTEKESMTNKSQQLDDLTAQLKVFVDEFDETDFDGYTLDELRENDPGQYLKVTEQQAKRKAALKKAQGVKADDNTADTTASAAKAIDKLTKDNGWLEDGKETAAYKKDVEIVKTYLTGLGYTDTMMQGILTTGHGQAYIDAAKYHASKKSNAAITKKVRKAPVMTKPGGAQRSAVHSELEKAIADHKKLGSVDSAFRLQKIRRKLKGT